MRKSTLSLVCSLILLGLLSAQAQAAPLRYFPDIEGYHTLICDFHTHTVFSDGQVWPDVRVNEAGREGLDAIAITDHIEYQPHRDDLPTNHNRPYAIAKQKAQQMNVLLVKGTEITRDTPPGHYNALFLDNIDPLEIDGFLDCIQQANQQNAFVFWNHHTWQGEVKGTWEEVQTRMYEKKWLHGMEVANGGTYYPKAHQWCLDRGMTMMGNSDIHAPSIQSVYTAQEHRTLTLVFARERTVASIEEALKAGRTAVWYKNQLIGHQPLLTSLFTACVKVHAPHDADDRQVRCMVSNSALIDLKINYKTPKHTRQVTLPARSRTLVTVPIQPEGVTPLDMTVTNFLVAPNQGLSIHREISKSLTIK